MSANADGQFVGFATLMVYVAVLLTISVGDADAHDDNSAAYHRESYPLHSAARAQRWGDLDSADLDSVNHFLNVHKIDVNVKDDYGHIPLLLAAYFGHASIVSLLIAAGADVNMKSNFDDTPLHMATRDNDPVPTMSMLLAAGADANAKNSDGDTPLHNAIVNYHNTSVVSVLLAAGADANAKNNRDEMALHWAAFRGYLHIVNLLLETGVKVNAKTHNGWTPLHAAADQGHLNVIIRLLEVGADVKAKDNDGQTPQHAASAKGHVNVANRLQRGIRPSVQKQESGQEDARDGYKTIQDIKMLAKQGDANAQFRLGVAYSWGSEVPRDEAESIKWYRRAAEQGLATAQYVLGHKYYYGYGVRQDYTEAANWFHLAAEQGYYEAQNDLGKAYKYGRGVSQNYAEAVKWYRLAAEQGYDNSQASLGYAYYNGEGVPQNYWEAYVWFSIALANGAKTWEENRDAAAEKLSPAQLSAAQIESTRRHAEIERRKRNNTSQSTSGFAISGNDAESIYENTWRSVVVVFAGDTQGGGVIMGSPNQVATNCHVVDESPYDIRVYKGEEQRANRGRSYSAEIISGDRKRDVCILSIPGLWGIAAEIRAAGDLEIGEAVYAVGAPQGFDFSISDGIVSQLRILEGENAPLIQTSAAISPGSSGGGLFDSQGRLVGLTTWKIREGENLNFAVPVDWALELQ